MAVKYSIHMFAQELHSVPHNSNSLISKAPSTPKITPLAKLTLLQRKMAKIRLSQIKSSAFKISSYAGPSVISTRYYRTAMS